MVGHLQVFAVEVVGVRAFQRQVATLYAGIAQEDQRLPTVPDAHNHRVVVVGVYGESRGHAHYLQLHAVEVEHATRLLNVCDGNVRVVQTGVEVAALLGLRRFGIDYGVCHPRVIDGLYLQVLRVCQYLVERSHVVVMRV